MFGFGQNKNKTDKRKKKSKELQADDTECGIKHNQSLAGDALRAQALDNARKARAHIGEETIQKIAAAMAKKENNPMAVATRQLSNADSDRISDEILYMLDDK